VPVSPKTPRSARKWPRVIDTDEEENEGELEKDEDEESVDETESS
jgi:hypothetical protein